MNGDPDRDPDPGTIPGDDPWDRYVEGGLRIQPDPTAGLDRLRRRLRAEMRIAPRRPWVLRAGAAAAALLAAGLAWRLLNHPPPPHGGPLADGRPVSRGQSVSALDRPVRLELGGYCSVRLEPGSAVTVEGRERAEQVFLERGRVTCDVRKGAGSFVLRAEAGTVTVDGTRFEARLDEGKEGAMRPRALVVTVFAGAVLLSGPDGGRRLAAGESARLAPAPAPAQAAPADPSALPVIFWHSQPVRPGQTLMLSGAHFEPGALVEIAKLPDADPGTPSPFNPNDPALGWTTLRPLQVTPRTIGVLLPAGPPAVFACRVRAGSRTGPARLVNAPDPWFVQGDLGETASPGGWIGVFGTCLDLAPGHAATERPGAGTRRAGPAPRIALLHAGRVVKTLMARPKDGTHYGQFFDLDGTVAGPLEVYVHNGWGGRYAWTRYEGMTSDGRALPGITIAPPPPWPAHVVNVVAAGGATDDERFAAALKQCSRGGILLVPAGTYSLTRTLELPDRTLVRGAGKDATVLRWTKEPPAPNGRPAALVKGKNFSLEDLTLENAAGDACRAIQTHNGTEPRHIRNVRCKAPNAAGPSKNAGEALFMGGTRNLAVTGCEFDMRAGITLHGWEGGPNQFLRLENNTIRWRSDAFRVMFSSSQVIFRGNRLVMAGTFTGNGYTAEMNPNPGDWFGTWGFNARDLYYAGNESAREEAEPPHGSIGLTFDGGQGVYWGRVVSTRGTTMTLASSTATPSGIPGSCDRGAVVRIVHGRGAGQWRHLVSPATRQKEKPGPTITLDRPWEIEPDGSSWVSISDFQGRTLFVGNRWANHPNIQTYFGTHDIVYAENRLGVPGAPFNAPVWVGVRRGGLATGWHYQVLDNLVEHRGGRFVTSVNAKDPPAGYDGPLTGLHVYRGNAAADSNASFTLRIPSSTEGLLVEDNRGLAGLETRDAKGTTGIVRGNLNAKGSPVWPAAPPEGLLVVR